MSLKKDDIKELKSRGFDTSNMIPKAKRKTKRSFDFNMSSVSFSVDIKGVWIGIAIILFVIMLLFIPQCLYYMKLLELLG